MELEKEQLELRDVERTLKAAADPARLRILRMLREGPLCVCQMVEVLGLSQSTVSKHLLLLKSAGWIEAEKRGKWVFYKSTPKARRGPFRPALARLLAEVLVREPRVAQDLRRIRQPEVRGLAACCPAPSSPPGDLPSMSAPTKKRSRPASRRGS